MNDTQDRETYLAQVASDFAPGGAFASAAARLGWRWEGREQQREMAQMVAEVIDERCVGVVEAPTGTGKTVGYLGPAVRAGKRVVISTHTKNLQDQIMMKDIPFVRAALGAFSATALKGLDSYVCAHHLGQPLAPATRAALAALKDPRRAPRWTGELEMLKRDGVPYADTRALARDPIGCQGGDCASFGECYGYAARAAAQNAQVVVTNHHLLLLNAGMGWKLFDEPDVLIVDEAHQLLDSATGCFTIELTWGRIQALTSHRLTRATTHEATRARAMNAVVAVMDEAEARLNTSGEREARLSSPITAGDELAAALAELAWEVSQTAPHPPTITARDIFNLHERISELGDEVALVCGVASPEMCYTVTRTGRRERVKLQAEPITPGATLRRLIWENRRFATIACSATLTTMPPARANREKDAWACWARGVGLTGVERASALSLDHVFDYRTHALLYLPQGIRAPDYGDGRDDYLDEVAEEIAGLVRAAHGRALILFTSKSALNGVQPRLSRLLSAREGFRLIAQDDVSDRAQLLETLRHPAPGEMVALLGLKSFWEGVDVAGEALSLVVIDKLPFAPIDSPLAKARLELAGRASFTLVTLPSAILALKQGVGRLIRTQDDTGVMAVLDTRLATSRYGGLIRAALPPAPVTRRLGDVEQFFE